MPSIMSDEQNAMTRNLEAAGSNPAPSKKGNRMAAVEMHLDPGPFEKIKQGKKHIEVRIYDEKRRAVKLGDIIIFIKRPSETERLKVEVVGLSIFKTFRDLFANVDKLELGHDANLNIEDQIKTAEEHYSKEEEKQNGVVGIHIRLIG